MADVIAWGVAGKINKDLSALSTQVSTNTQNIEANKIYVSPSGCLYTPTSIINFASTSVAPYAYAGVSDLLSADVYTCDYVGDKTGIKYVYSGAFRKCLGLKSITIYGNAGQIASYAFQFDSNLTDITLLGTFTSVATNAFLDCTAIQNVTLATDWNCDLDLSASNLITVDSLLQMIGALKNNTGTTAKTLTIGATNIAKLTAEQIAVATNKNWNLA